MYTDREEYFRRISDTLNKSGFGWVVQQALEQIDLGQPVVKEVQAISYENQMDEDSFEHKTPRRRKASLVSTEPYDAGARLNILLQAVEAAIISRFNIESALLDMLEIKHVEYEPEVLSAASALSVRHQLEPDRTTVARPISNKLIEIMREIRRETDVGS